MVWLGDRAARLTHTKPRRLYICCANLELSWKCRSCGKIDEGFAFPYGMCPHCKGKLENFERDYVEDGSGVSAIRAAFEIELGGQAFYSRAASDSTGPALRELFGRFAAVENEHMATLSRRYHVDVPPPAADCQLDRAAIFAGVKRRPDDPQDLFRIAIAFEERAVEFFSEHGARAPEGSVEREL